MAREWKRFLASVLVMLACTAWADNSGPAKKSGAESSTLALTVKEALAFSEAWSRLGECFLGFADLRYPAQFGVLLVGYWVTDDDIWLLRLSTSEKEVQLAAVRILVSVNEDADSLLRRRARSGMLDCSELEKEQGKLFEVIVVPPEKAERLGRDLVEALGRVQVPVTQAYVLHSDDVLLVVYTSGGLEVVLFNIAPPSPSLSRWLERFREVILKEGVKMPFGEKSGSGDVRP